MTLTKSPGFDTRLGTTVKQPAVTDGGLQTKPNSEYRGGTEMADGQVNKLMSPEEVTTAVMAWEGGDVRDILVMLGLDAPPKKLRLIVSMDVEPGLDVSVDAIAVAVRRALGHGVGNIRVSRAREV